jgi:hypothetical protein
VLNALVAVLESLLASANPGANLVDLFPSLDRLPDILAPWRTGVMQQQDKARNMAQSFLDTVRGKVKRGELASDETLAGRLWNDKEKLQLDQLDVAFIAATVSVSHAFRDSHPIRVSLNHLLGSKQASTQRPQHYARSFLLLFPIRKHSSPPRLKSIEFAGEAYLRWMTLRSVNTSGHCARRP